MPRLIWDMPFCWFCHEAAHFEIIGESGLHCPPTLLLLCLCCLICGPRQANLVLIAYAISEGSGEPAHPRSLARTSAARTYKHWVKRNLQTESQIPGPSEWLGMRSKNLSWRNARRHKFAWRGPCHKRACGNKSKRNKIGHVTSHDVAPMIIGWNSTSGRIISFCVD